MKRIQQHLFVSNVVAGQREPDARLLCRGPQMGKGNALLALVRVSRTEFSSDILSPVKGSHA